MSVSDKKNPSHCRNDSAEELDVFAASRYFSTAAENQPAAAFPRKPARMSLDMPMIMMRQNMIVGNNINNINDHHVKSDNNKKQYYKQQPSSPGGKLASFLNSLFNQTSLKKSKKSKSAAKDLEDDHQIQNPSGRRKRRSSISHFKFTSTSNKNTTTTTNDDDDDSKSFYSSLSTYAGFRTPPPPSYNNNNNAAANTPNKASYKDFRSAFAFSDDQNKVVSKINGGGNNYYSEKIDNINSKNINVGIINWNNIDEEREFRKFSDVDDHDGDSDSSSDLFDLPNHDLDFYPTGLPVYETTHMDRIKIKINGSTGGPISTS